MSRNPYHGENELPTMQRSVLTFMDILGYSRMTRDSNEKGTQQAMLHDLYGALVKGRKWLEGESPSHYLSKDKFAIKAFTDNIVVGWPVADDGEAECGLAFSRVAAFQFEMVLHGFFLRGAISINDAYVDEIAVFGAGLIEAHHAESILARDPRIILTESAVATVRQHLRYYGKPSFAPQTRDLLCDSDGQWFVNYLETVLLAEDEAGPFYEPFLTHKGAVESKLEEFKADPPIWSKYAWVARYHNYFCDLYPHHFGPEHRIDVSLYQRAIDRIG